MSTNLISAAFAHALDDWVTAEWHDLGVLAPDPPPPRRCPHCARDWHDAALTQQVATMLAHHHFDPGYRVTDDDSGIVCVGSSSCGPNPNPRSPSRRGDVEPVWMSKVAAGWAIDEAWLHDELKPLKATLMGIYQFSSTVCWWTPGPSAPVSFFAAPPSPPPCGDPVICFGPEHWPVGHDPEAVAPGVHTDLLATVAAAAWQAPLVMPVSSGPTVAVLAALFDAAHNPKKFPPKKGFST